MATAREVETAIKELLSKLDGAQIKDMSLPDKKVVSLRIRDLDVVYRASFRNGRFTRIAKAQTTGDEDVRIAVSSDDFIGLTSGRMGLASALLTGRLRVEAGAKDLLLLRQLL